MHFSCECIENGHILYNAFNKKKEWRKSPSLNIGRWLTQPFAKHISQIDFSDDSQQLHNWLIHIMA